MLLRREPDASGNFDAIILRSLRGRIVAVPIVEGNRPMFEVIRRKRRIAQGILLLLILPFAFFGIERYFSGDPSHQEAAKVGDAVVTTAELRRAVEERTAQLRQRFGENFDARIVSDPAFVDMVLRELIERRLVQVETARLGVVVTIESRASPTAMAL